MDALEKPPFNLFGHVHAYNVEHKMLSKSQVKFILCTKYYERRGYSDKHDDKNIDDS